MSEEAFQRVLAIEKMGWNEDPKKSTYQLIFDFRKKPENQSYLDKWIALLTKEEKSKTGH